MDAKQANPVADRFSEAFDHYCQRNGIFGDLVAWAEGIALSFYKEGYNHACADHKRIEEVVFAKGAK